MDLRRFWRHARMTPWTAARAFPESTLAAIERAVGEDEKRHRGEVRFVVEAELTSGQLWRGLTPRQRAVQVFAELGVWDTEENSGVLVYVLLADHRVEIVADRGIDARVSHGEWQEICDAMRQAFGGGRYREGALSGLASIAALLARHFPAGEGNRNELPDRPVLM